MATAVVAVASVVIGAGVRWRDRDPNRSGVQAVAATVSVAGPVGATAEATVASAATTATVATAAADDGTQSARAVLDSIPVELEHRGGYDRDLFPTWLDSDIPGCTVRDRVLLDESRTPVQRQAGCGTAGGSWLSAYDGLVVIDPAALEVDHVVALKEAWDSGAWAWPAERRIAYANDLTDPRTLLAVSGVSNQAKSDKDPSNWVPRDAEICRFVADWVAIKARWSMTMDPSEWGRVKNLLEGRCAGTRLAAWPPAP